MAIAKSREIKIFPADGSLRVIARMSRAKAQLREELGTVRREFDVATGEPAKAINQRSDVTAVPAAGVVAEAMVALVLAEAAMEKFGGDSVEELRRNAEGYAKSLVIS